MASDVEVHHDSASHVDPAEIRHHVRQYMMVFGGLMILTVVTVGVSYLRLAVPAAITVALAIAVVKGSMVASFFMHLISERKMVYWVLLLTAVFFVTLLLWPTLMWLDRVRFF